LFYLTYLKILHHSSSLFNPNSEAIQKMTSLKSGVKWV